MNNKNDLKAYDIQNATNMDSEGLRQLIKNSNWYLAAGIGLIVLGILAITYAITATIFSVIYLGAVLISIGVFESIQSFKLNKWGYFFFRLFLSFLYIASGIFIALFPKINAITLTLILAIFFVITGAFRIIFSIVNNPPHQGWLIFNGILTVLLGALIWWQWPYSGLWAIGLLVGIDALFTGWTWTILAVKAKQLKNNHQ